MPFKSQAQRRKFAELLLKGKISNETFEEWNRETGGARLPERVKPKARPKTRSKTRSKRKPKAKATGDGKPAAKNAPPKSGAADGQGAKGQQPQPVRSEGGRPAARSGGKRRRVVIDSQASRREHMPQAPPRRPPGRPPCRR